MQILVKINCGEENKVYKLIEVIEWECMVTGNGQYILLAFAFNYCFIISDIQAWEFNEMECIIMFKVLYSWPTKTLDYWAIID